MTTPLTNGQGSGSLLTSSARLSKIDLLREKNIGTYLPLPQLVAVGDQSSGKSSLLESLTGIPFPRGQELCTRYATQITSRREELAQIKVRIIPGPAASSQDKEKLEAYRRQVGSTAQLYAEFPTILDEVNQLMGIRSNKNPGGNKTFSQDVLRIEKCGPQEDYLTIIDVPGIFRTTDEVTTAHDRDLVKNMVKDYIQDPRTIILAVLPSNVDVATQEILSLAEEHDKTGERTIGVLTKPDLLKERSAKVAVCNLIGGKRKPLNLGYYLVRNRGGDDIEDGVSDLDQREDMFREDPWRSLPPHRLGIDALRATLIELLGQVTDKVFPILRSETRQVLARAQKQLEELGPPRQTEREQQQYLAAMASKFQSLARAALSADYSAQEEFTDTNLRLITAVVNITDRFNTDFEGSAHAYVFDTAKEKKDLSLTSDWFSTKRHKHKSSALAEKSSWGPEDKTEDLEDDLDKLCAANFPDLEGIVSLGREGERPSFGIMEWIKRMYRGSRGLELGTFGSIMLSSAFREQSQKWASFARQYVSRIIFVIHRFIVQALECACTDVRAREEIISTMTGELLSKYESGMKQALFLVNIERDKRPYTLNHYFNSNLQTSRGLRLTEILRPKAVADVEDNPVIKLSSVASAVTDKSNAEQDTEDIHDILEAYYKVARKRFVDNVYHQAVDHYLLSGPMSPLAVFSEQWVLQLDAEKLSAIAGESRLTRERRGQLEKTVRDMEEAIEILR